MTPIERRRMTMDLFNDMIETEPRQVVLDTGAMILRRFAVQDETAILAALDKLVAQAPFRHMITPSNHRMSVAMTNCGTFGWASDSSGYRYDDIDPISSQKWPPMPNIFLNLAKDAAAQAGFQGFVPDACLVNRYEPGAKLSLHQDKDERDLNQPIVSVSLGIPAVFVFGGLHRADKVMRVQVTHGDVVVWGGPARLRYHGVLPLKEACHPLVGNRRITLSFRTAA
jgi:alkylated DNA repair protein (DNA oxidative demethylase)